MNTVIGYILVIFGVIIGIFTVVAEKRVEKQLRCTKCHKLNNEVGKKCEFCNTPMKKQKVIFKSTFFGRWRQTDKNGVQSLKRLRQNALIDIAVNMLIAIIGVSLLVVVHMGLA